ncbi:DNA polymerase III subunit gamma/tau [Halanaerobium hydrogeniformans]|uniref:DNA-directed DNA polymerase n=1 Tax=Halanaerobium hydrogeniformans TaxID=656519 RepID=E4RPC6_HALHG|nr:DNA polymerase III subunit gamma/tau [Halanaerobium hydrogeniformans]ADQ13811.1 DNA polymerase III, subunits gamma and tau [Halanaerobium hydrogeniformans]
MSFLSLYRKYRPEDFTDLIGQDHVVQTLKNALKNDRVAHAYLFAGPRGTGKTSTAKVFAKALNCADPAADLEPCGECNSCQRISSGSSLDVIEIDAASNRGIDEIRELREKVKFYPGEGQYKVYIIDEVHMLTTGAFNALLKTLEEPPDSVVFILATTEPHKVITTIMSRCQRFDFTLLSLGDIKMRLKYIAEQEGYEIDAAALDILARSARGGMRDGISLLDQAISFSDGQLAAEEIARMLGRVNKDKLKEFLLYLSKNQSQKALQLLDKQLEAGLGIERFSDELVAYCRELLLIKECGVNSGILEYSQSYLEELADAAANLSTTRITNIIDEFAKLKQKLRSSASPRLQLEISVIKLSSKQSAESSLEARLSQLEFKLNDLLQKGSIAVNKEVQKPVQPEVENRAKKSSSKQAETQAESTQNKKAAQPEQKKAVPAQKEANSAEGDLSLEKVKNYWAKLLSEIRKRDISVQALLREAEPTAVEGKKIIIVFPEDKKFHFKGARSNQSLISNVIGSLLNQYVELEFILGDYKKKSLNEQKSSQSRSDKAAGENTNFQSSTSAKKSSQRDKNQSFGIKEIARIFSGEIIEVDETILEKKGGN